MKTTKAMALWLFFFLQVPAAIILLIAGLYWFTDGVSGLAHGVTAAEKDSGIFYLLVGCAVCYLALRIFDDAFADTGGGRR